MTTQLVALVLIAFTDGGGVATSQKLGEFYDMGACERAAKAAHLVGGEDVHVRFACVPLTPVSSTTLTPRP